MPLLVATGNTGKLREFASLLSGLDVVGPSDIGLELEVEETGSTFEENALLKAEAYAAASGLISLADDSGLEVDALGGEPGVLSARYGGPDLDDAGRCSLLLRRLAAHPKSGDRAARFRCTLVAASPDGRRCRATGTCEGHIAPAPRGSGGFGYDPVFFLPDRGCTMAEVSPDVKNEISHRGRALRAIRPMLPVTFPELSS